MIAAVLSYRLNTLALSPMGQDQARDTHYALRIAQGEEFPLLGPSMSIDLWARYSPIYYYLIAIGCLFAKTPFAPVIEASVLWWAALVMAYLALRRAFDGRHALFATLFLLVSPELLHMTDTVWNPFLLVVFSLMAFSFSILFARSGKPGWWYGFALSGAICAHLHPMAGFVALAFLPIAALQDLSRKHKLISGASCLLLAVPMLLGMFGKHPSRPLTKYCLAIYLVIGPLIVIGHSVLRELLPRLTALYFRYSRIAWGLVLAASIFFIWHFGADPSRPTLWLLAFFALLNAVGKKSQERTSQKMAMFIEPAVVLICLMPLALILAVRTMISAQPGSHHFTYIYAVVGVWVGLRLVQVAQKSMGAITRTHTLRQRGLNRAIMLGSAVLLALGHIWGHALLVGNSYLFTFAGSQKVVEALLEQFGNDERLFGRGVFVYGNQTGQDDENCGMYVYYHLLKGQYAKPKDEAESPYALIVPKWQAPRDRFRNCFLATPQLSILRFDSVPHFVAWLRSLKLRHVVRAQDFWQVRFYVDGYSFEKWLRIALAND